MKKKLTFILFIIFMIPLYATDIAPIAADNISALEVVFSYNVTGYFGFSTKRVVTAAPVESVTSDLEIVVQKNNVQYLSDYVHIFWQIFIPQKVAIELVEYPPLQGTVNQELFINWENNLDTIAISSTETPSPIPIYTEEKLEKKELDRPRIGSKEIQITIPEDEVTKIAPDQDELYTAELKIQMRTLE